MRLHVHEWGDPRRSHGRLRARRLGARPALPQARRGAAGAHFRVLAPDLRGHGRSDWDPPWNLETHLDDLLETFSAAGVAARRGSATASAAGSCWSSRARAPGAAHVRGPARPRDPDPAARRLRLRAGGRAGPLLRVASDEAIEARLASGAPDPARGARGGGARAPRPRRPTAGCAGATPRGASSTMYSELCREPPPLDRARRVPTLLVHAEQFGLVREDQLEEYAATLGEQPRARRRAGRAHRLLGRVRADRRRGREVPDSSQSRFTRVNRPPLG